MYTFTAVTVKFIDVSDIEEVQALEVHIFLRISVFFLRGSKFSYCIPYIDITFQM